MIDKSGPGKIHEVILVVIGFPHGGKKYVYIICKLILYLPCNTCKFLHVRCFQNIFNQGHFDVNTLFNFFFTFS